MSTLYIIATPIGNLSDITARAIETLRQVDIIAAEDTRHSQPLLQHYQIQKPLLAYHEHNVTTMTAHLINLLQQGKSIALISDAGTPLISDPGYLLVKYAHQENIPVIPLPGPCAAIAALSVAGLPSDKFVFEGFLPAKSSARLNRLRELVFETRTLIFYEAPHRLLATLTDCRIIFGENRGICLAKELTKLFETIKKTTINVLIDWLHAHSSSIKGEFVLIIEGASAIQQKQTEIAEAYRLLNMLLLTLPLKKAVKITAEFTGVAKNALYQHALAWQNLSSEEYNGKKN